MSGSSVISHYTLAASAYSPRRRHMHSMTSGSGDCLRLRGLPFEARVTDVVEFMGVHAAHIIQWGVHMIFNAQGKPSGEAFIEMGSVSAAGEAALRLDKQFMRVGNKQRYIDVFQCSRTDMHLIAHAAPIARPPFITTRSAVQIVAPGHVFHPSGFNDRYIAPGGFKWAGGQGAQWFAGAHYPVPVFDSSAFMQYSMPYVSYSHHPQ